MTNFFLKTVYEFEHTCYGLLSLERARIKTLWRVTGHTDRMTVLMPCQIMRTLLFADKLSCSKCVLGFCAQLAVTQVPVQ